MDLIKPLISHESPLSILRNSKDYNDYDYILVHLLDQYEEYYSFFKECRGEGRRSIMDTSIFELGHAFDTDKYVYWINQLTPTEYILPDVLEDFEQTISNSSWFASKYSDLPGKKIGVVQGKTYNEISSCYTQLDKVINADKIAISFDYSYYRDLFPHPNKWISFMMGRVFLINKLYNDNIINPDKPHHLLGCSNPMEFSFYKNEQYRFIESIDTSSPVVHGLKRITYEDKIGDWVKESTKLADLIEAKVDDDQMRDILYNITKFRQYVR